jgi:predicted small integral membrane protein
MWRAIRAPWVHLAFYFGIIFWEMFNMFLCFRGAYALFRNLRAPVASFQEAKALGIYALASGMLQWFIAFLCVGAEWFLMWQSKIWNGQEAAFRMFAIEGIVLTILLLPEHEA